ncbi:MAG: 2-C-methyl-D-erythritol 4-phosphate cytidylyltransferase [Frankiaceae bacterium]|nr:2-C-methyl-D-erythritol 4-phosphate cytidylyltransferase [Frankiaceae bacterium]
MTVAAVVPAAGRGERLGPGEPKALRLLGGTTLLAQAVARLQSAAQVDLVVVAVPDGEQDRTAAELGVRTVVGGADRRASVAAALAALPDHVDVVLVHDAARPLAPSSLADAVVGAVHAGYLGVVPGLPLTDTIKQVDADGIVVATHERGALRAIQTPQGFRRDVLERAHAQVPLDSPVTDDAGLLELLGIPVLVIDGAEDAFKVTRPADLGRAEARLAVLAGEASR